MIYSLRNCAMSAVRVILCIVVFSEAAMHFYISHLKYYFLWEEKT